MWLIRTSGSWLKASREFSLIELKLKIAAPAVGEWCRRDGPATFGMLGELGATGPRAASKMGVDGPPGLVAGESGSTTAKPIACPLVLQCGSCRTIVGDTCTIVDLNSELRTVTLESKP